MESFEQIAEGMLEKDVEKLLGGRYGQYFSGTAHVMLPFGPHNSTGIALTDKLAEDQGNDTITFNTDPPRVIHRKGWVGDQISIWIFFDENNRVIDKLWYPVTLKGWWQ
jgi:hypothetical protein